MGLFGFDTRPPDRAERRTIAALWVVLVAASAGLVDLTNLGHRIVDPQLGTFRSYYSADRLERLNENRRARWPARQPPIPPFQPWQIQDQFLNEATWHVQARNEAFDAEGLADRRRRRGDSHPLLPRPWSKKSGIPEGDLRHAFPADRVRRLDQEGAVPVPTYESAAGGNRIWIWPRFLAPALLLLSVLPVVPLFMVRPPRR